MATVTESATAPAAAPAAQPQETTDGFQLVIEALEARDTSRAEELVRNHALGLAEHVKRYADYLD